MPNNKRRRIDVPEHSGIERLPVPLLYDMLTNPSTAVVNPRVLRLVSRTMRDRIDAVCATPGFWHQLTALCFPLAGAELAPNAEAALSNGRYGPVDTPASLNAAWKDQWTRIWTMFSHASVVAEIERNIPGTFYIGKAFVSRFRDNAELTETLRQPNFGETLLFSCHPNLFGHAVAYVSGMQCYRTFFPYTDEIAEPLVFSEFVRVLLSRKLFTGYMRAIWTPSTVSVYDLTRHLIPLNTIFASIRPVRNFSIYLFQDLCAIPHGILPYSAGSQLADVLPYLGVNEKICNMVNFNKDPFLRTVHPHHEHQLIQLKKAAITPSSRRPMLQLSNYVEDICLGECLSVEVL